LTDVNLIKSIFSI